MPDFIGKILTPTGRAILGFVQLVAYVGTGLLVVYHFTVGHRDAQAATMPHPSSKLEHKIDVALDAINDLRIDVTALMDKAQVPQTQRASSRHAIPANYAEER